MIEVLALLTAGAALIVAARALRLAHHTYPATPADTTTTTRPTEPAPPPHPTTPTRAGQPGNRTQPGNGGGQARGNALRDQLRGFLTEHAGQDFSLVELSKAVDRRTATVSYAVTKLVDAGEVQLTSPKPRRYAITPTGATTVRHPGACQRPDRGSHRQHPGAASSARQARHRRAHPDRPDRRRRHH